MQFNLSKPEDIFTPRNAKVHPQMYVHRPHLESQLRDALKSTKHIIIFGESGNGKSWLYKKVFQDTKTSYATINLANASRLGSLNAAMANKIARSAQNVEIGSTVDFEGGVMPGGIGAKGKVSTNYRKEMEEPFEALLKKNKGISSKQSVVVLDNFESISDNKALLKELSDIIVLLDDEDYAQYNCKVCIVGVPADIREYLSEQPHAAAVATRISEIEEVARMTENEARSLLEHGFKLLRLQFPQGDVGEEVILRLLHVSDRIALELQELGLLVSLRARENEGVIERLVIEDAIAGWIKKYHSAACMAIEARMSRRESTRGRRSQILYCLGKIETHDFWATDLAAMVRAEFPNSADWLPLEFRGIFDSLLIGSNPIVKRVARSDAFRIASAKYRMAIRSLLGKAADGSVYKFSRAL